MVIAGACTFHIRQSTSDLVHFENIALLVLQVLDELLGLLELPALLLCHRLRERLVQVRHRPSWSTEVEVSASNESLGENLLVLLDLVLDINLVRSITRECQTGVGEKTGGEVRLDVLAVQVLGAAVTRAKVEVHRSSLDTLRSLPGSVVHESLEGG